MLRKSTLYTLSLILISLPLHSALAPSQADTSTTKPASLIEVISKCETIKYKNFEKLCAPELRALLNAGADINERIYLDRNHKSNGYTTPLRRAIDCVNKNAVKWLIKNDANPSSEFSIGSPAWYAYLQALQYNIDTKKRKNMLKIAELLMVAEVDFIKRHTPPIPNSI